ncbi:hypothetical protein BGZ76_004681 [Entomortierella beljakovae]|nr:hypothetical protein BGZ76_004681 [Entomortierella beljakovae]
MTSPSPSSVPSVASTAKDKKVIKEREPRKTFWTAAGVDTLVDWLSDHDNYKRLNTVRHVSGHKPGDVRREIAVLVNDKHGTNWDEPRVKAKFQYVKKKYQEAKAVLKRAAEDDTEDEALRGKVLEICPPYDRLHVIFAETLPEDPLPQLCVGDKSRPLTFESDTETDSESDSSESNAIRNVPAMYPESREESVRPKKRKKTSNNDSDSTALALTMLNFVQRMEEIVSKQQQQKEVHHDTLGSYGGENAWIVRALTSEREVALLKHQLGIAKSERDKVEGKWEKKEEEWEKKKEEWRKKKEEWEKKNEEREKKKEEWEKKKEEWEKKKDKLNDTLFDLMKENLELKAALHFLQPKS